MKRLLDLLLRPLYASLLMGIVLGTLVYYVGNWTLAPSQKAEEQELVILSHKVAHAFYATQRDRGSSTRRRGDRTLINQALGRAAEHPRVVWTSLRAADNRLLGMAFKERGRPGYKTAEVAFPITGSEGEQLAIITFAMSGEPRTVTALLERRVRWYAGLGFAIGFFVSYALFRRRNTFLPNLVSAVRSVGAGQLDVDLIPPKDGEFADLARNFNQMLDALRDRDRMKNSLGRIMDPKIAEILIKEDPKVGGLRRQATIMFCDIRNYTSLCEQLKPEELQDFLNEYWKGTVEIIMEQEGTIDKFHGDGVCVVFGAPYKHSDDPLRAVRTAWRLVRNVDILNIRRESQRKTPIQIGIGIHSGEVIAGHIGSERRMDYTVVGDVVNVAARIEELNKKFGTKILMSDQVYESVENYVRVKTLTLAHLRGHKRPILVHALREFCESPIEALPEDLVPNPEEKRDAA